MANKLNLLLCYQSWHIALYHKDWSYTWYELYSDLYGATYIVITDSINLKKLYDPVLRMYISSDIHWAFLSKSKILAKPILGLNFDSEALWTIVKCCLHCICMWVGVCVYLTASQPCVFIDCDKTCIGCPNVSTRHVSSTDLSHSQQFLVSNYIICLIQWDFVPDLIREVFCSTPCARQKNLQKYWPADLKILNFYYLVSSALLAISGQLGKPLSIDS